MGLQIILGYKPGSKEPELVHLSNSGSAAQAVRLADTTHESFTIFENIPGRRKHNSNFKPEASEQETGDSGQETGDSEQEAPPSTDPVPTPPEPKAKKAKE